MALNYKKVQEWVKPEDHLRRYDGPMKVYKFMLIPTAKSRANVKLPFVTLADIQTFVNEGRKRRGLALRRMVVD